MKRCIKYFVVYYTLGIALMNTFTVSRFLGSASVSELAPRIIQQNMSSPTFYGLAIVWPIYLGFNIYNFATANFSE